MTSSWFKPSIGSDHRTTRTTASPNVSDIEVRNGLEATWGKFKSSKPEEAGAILKDFVQRNYPNYLRWSPDHEPQMHAPIFIALLDADSIQQIVTLFNKYVLELSTALTEADSQNGNQLPDGLYLLYLINQMSSNTYNAKMIMQYDFTILMHPIKVVKLATYKLWSYVNKPMANAEFMRWWQFLEIIVANCLQTIARFGNGRRWLTDNFLGTEVISSPPSPNMQSVGNTTKTIPGIVLHNSLNSLPTSPNGQSYPTNKSSSWSNLPLLPTTSPRGEGIRIGNNMNHSHDSIKTLPPYQPPFTGAVPNKTSPIKTDPPESPTGSSNFVTAANQSSSHSSGGFGTNHGSGTFRLNSSGGNSGSYGSFANGGSGNFNGFLTALEDVDATDTLLKQGIVKTLKDLLKAVRELVPDANSFIILALSALGAIVYNSSSARAKVQEDDLLSELKEWLGWRTFMQKGAPISALREEFKRQILVLRVIRECIHQDITNATRLSEIGGYNGVLDVILWVSECFEPTDNHACTELFAAEQLHTPLLHAYLVSDPGALLASPKFNFGEPLITKPVPATIPTLPSFSFRSRVSELDQLFGVLYTMCVISEPQGSNSKQSRVGNKTIISVLLESLFNEHIRQTAMNSQSRYTSRSSYPELQFVVLEFLSRLIYETNCIEQCTAYHMWDVLFSEYFFRAGEKNSTELQVNGASTKLDQRTERRRQYLFTRLLVSILQVVQFCGSLPNHDNTEECRILLELMDTYCGNPWVVLHTCQVIMYLLLNNSTRTQSTLQQLSTYAVLSQLIDNNHSMKQKDKEANIKISGIGFEQAHVAVIGVLGKLLSSEQVVAAAISDKHVPATLFTLLRDPDSESFALNTIVALLRSTDNVLLLKALSARYIKFMADLQEEAPDQTFHLLLSLMETIRNVVRTNPKQQKIFREVDAFIRVVNFLNVETSKERLPKLCTGVLLTIAALIAGNNKNKEYLRTVIGYEQVKNLILKAEGSVVSSVTLDILFDMIVDSKLDKESIGLCTIKNPDIVILLFNLFPYFPFKQQAQMLDMFIPLIEFSSVNQSLCCSCHLIYTLLGLITRNLPDTLTRKIAKLVEILGTHSITVRELKRLFGLLKTEPGDFRPSVTTILIPSIQNMALKRSYGPQVYFDFDGRSSGLHLPTFERYPFPKGFTFVTWLRIESFDDPADKPKYEPRLLSLLTDDGQGIEAYFERQYLTIHVISSSGRKVAFSNPLTFEFRERRWYFVAITFSNSRIMQSEVRLYVDGVCRQKASLKPPQIQSTFSQCRIGTNAEIQSPLHSIYRENPFYGQMGTIYMFDDVLAQNQITAICHLGPDYSDSFQEPGNDNSLTARLFWNYNCRAVDGKMCVDNSPDKTLDFSLDAKIVGVNSCITRDVKDIIHCLGGLKVLFPLFAQLSQPPSPRASMRQIDYSADPKLTIQVLGLLRDMLGSYTNQQEMLRSRGLAVVGFLMQQAPPGCLDVEVLTVLSELLSIPHLPDALKEDIFSYFFVDFRLWIYTAYDVQAALLSNILALQTTHPEMVRGLFGVQQILDVLRLYYWYTPDANSLGVNNIVHPVTKTVLGSRPNVDQVYQLRRVLSSILRVALLNHPPQSETLALCRSLLDSQDARHVAEMLEFILEQLEQYSENLSNKTNSTSSDSTPEEGIFDHILIIGGTELFLQLLRHEDEVVRVTCIRIVSQIHTISKSYFPGIGPGSIKLITRKRPKPNQDCTLITHILPTYPFTETVYTALFAFMLGISYDTALESRADTVYDYEIQIPDVLAAILKLLLSAEVPLRQRVLGDIGLLLLGSHTNRTSVLNLVGWQSWLLAIYTDPTERFKDSLEVVRELVLKIMAELILHAFSEEKTGWVLLERTMSIVKNCADRGVVDSILFTRALFGKILLGLTSDSRLTSHSNNNSTIFRPHTRKATSALVDNFIHFLARVDEHVTNAQELAIHNAKYENEKWVDQNIVSQSLQIVTLENLNIIPTACTNSKSLHNSKTKPRKSTYLFAAVMRITLRMSLICLSEAARMDDVSLCMEAVKKIRTVVERDLNKLDDGYDRLMVILGHTIRLLQALMARPRNMQKVFVSLMKDVLWKCKSVIQVRLLEKEAAQPITSAAEKEMSNWLLEVSDYTIPDICASVTTSPRWNFIADYAEEFKMALDEEDRQFAMVMERRRQKCQKEQDNKIENDDKVQTNTINKGDAELRTLQQTHTYPEQERRMLVSRLQKELTAGAANQWRRILRSLTNERGAWGTTEIIVHWKLDKTESISRMRLKLKRNYKFDDHRDAAHSVTSSHHIEKVKRNTEELLSGIKLTAIGGGDGDIPDEVIEEDDSKEELADAKTIFTAYCELVTPMNVTKGNLQITQTHLLFTYETGDGVTRDRKWAVDKIVELHLRRYLLRRSAMEIFLTDRTNYFLNFKKRDRNKAYNKLCTLNPSLNIGESKPEEIWKRSGLQQKWQARKISNFEYLMQLNTIAGRTYNDLTQYPVFPWVVADYTSTTLDFTNPATFRDLSKPIGALNPDRLTAFVERYETFDDPSIPKFHYGSHYSSAGIVLFYLIRMEPFTTLFLKLQGGRFDHADRMFDSIPNTWKNCLNGTMDVKELIPEFYCMPEFLMNTNNFNLGVKQTGTALGDVILPPWASTPHDFVRINREALESDYVSAHLHEWIDLIFGFKQRGRNAVDCYNVFYYLTYEGSVDIDKIEDPNLRRATESQIDNFGQTPAQLIKKRPHPARNPPSEAHISIFRRPEELQAYYMQISKSTVIFIGVPEFNPSSSTTSLNASTVDKIFTIDRSRTPAVHRWFPQAPLAQISPFTFELDQQLSSRRRVGVPFARDVTPSPLCFAVTADGRTILSCGHWDNSFKVSNSDTAKLMQSIAKHKDIVTCLALSSDNQTVVTGSRDTTLMVWDVVSKGSLRVEEVPRHILYGHDDEVTCVAVNTELDIVVSGSKDGTCIVHSLSDGEYVRSIYLPKASPISLVSISPQGYIVIYSPVDLVIYLYSINGKLLRSAEESERLNHMLVTRDSEYLITGGEKGIIAVRSFYSLKPLHTKLSVESTIFALALTPDERHLLVGLEEGKLLIITTKVPE